MNLKWFKLAEYIKYYSRVDKEPHFYHAFFLVPTFLRRGPQSILSFIRFVKCNKFNGQLFSSSNNPEIEILFVVASKDFNILPESISCAVVNSINSISKITIITRSVDVSMCEKLIDDLKFKIPVIVLNEDDVIIKSDRIKIRTRFRENYGWILQQLLTLTYILQSNSKGVLALDADTIVMKDTLWLNSHGEQILLVSHEYHKPYYQFLRNINLIKAKPKYTFVTHHMLFQPEKLRKIWSSIKVENISEVVNILVDSDNLKSLSPVCLEFEPYAQGLLLQFPTQVVLSRFCNIAFSAKTHQKDLTAAIKKVCECGLYKSASFHSWS